MRRLLGITFSLFLLVGVALPAQAVTPYYFLPGHPVFYTYGGTALGANYGLCTGGYVITGTDGMFILGAGCAVISSPVRGTSREFGFARYRNDATDLVSINAPDDALQLVVDPLTGATPSNGLIRGYMPTAEQTQGIQVGKMGMGSGWTEGQITGWITWRGGERAICTTMPAAAGDAGGPVWRWDEHGVRALGIVVAIQQNTGYACYLPIQGILNSWGAWLTVFGPTAYAPQHGDLSDTLPHLDETGYGVPISYVPATP